MVVSDSETINGLQTNLSTPEMFCCNIGALLPVSKFEPMTQTKAVPTLRAGKLRPDLFGPLH